ncbi:exopolygalacturonase-like [Momordica charantia]|uniref:Exopolygalacturonase-like n=1 Tax=Momordica charantia TaxID=3673 RepID=A0A6J1DUC6_MOMCH|nr:exopolygalacturonase-like [Momordica charantia]XP_022159278.1 exopolygalacturonase-like [Momordica charantia]
MGMELNLLILSVVLLFVSTTKAQSSDGIFDVTKFGAMPNADISKALMSAWKEACASPIQSKVIIPKVAYKLGTIDLTGPCKSPIEVQLQGTIQAPIDLTGEGWVQFKYIDHFTLSGGGTFDGQGKAAWEKNDCDKNPKCDRLPMSLRFSFITNSIVSDITSKDSKNFHVQILGCNNLTFQHVNVNAPGDSINTDGIHIGRSTGINILSTNIGTGDDCISLGDGSKQVTITNVTCGPGHGISVGSLGRYTAEEPVEGIRATNCTIMNTSNGVRIKTWPASPTAGTASDMHFEDMIMVNVSNPILIDQEYCPYNQCNKKSPSKVKISKVSFKNVRGSSANALAVKLVCSAEVPCEDVEVADIDLTYNGNEGPISSQCKNVKPIISGKQNPRACSSPAPPA